MALRFTRKHSAILAGTVGVALALAAHEAAGQLLAALGVGDGAVGR